MNYPFPISENLCEDQCAPTRILILSSFPIEFEEEFAYRFVFSPEDGFDAVLLLEAAKARTVETIIRQSNSYLLPVANLTDAPLPFADFQAGEQTAEIIARAIQELSRIALVVRTLPENARYSGIPETILLARAYSRKRVIEPAYDPSVRDCVIYPVAGLLEDPGRLAERMTNAGYLTRMFFDRLHACPACGSSRLNAREECVVCRSADLTDEWLIHHLRCGHRGLEPEFRQRKVLICPGCRLELRLEGVDYDRPGQANVCRSCGHVANQASVGFVCIDCKARHDSEAIATRDFYKYELTREGERALVCSEPWDNRETSTTGQSPQEATIRQALRLHSRYGRPLAILKISFEDENVRRNPSSLLAMTHASVHVGAILNSETRETDIVTEAEDGFFVYMPETSIDGLDSPSARLRSKIAASIPANFGVRITAVRPKDLNLAMIDTF